ncbi:MAG: glycerophosphodiester phosphodiesterase family protein [Planctomycetota bacterium]|nr:glycerophosphodiester phosphodiesterase family protein [Planctomycetota bacterium]
MNETLLLSLCGLAVLGVAAARDATAPVEKPLVVAHRGASEDAPENTLASFTLGFEQGADLIEGDFRMTADGRIVAMHDRTLARTTGDPRETSKVTRDDLRSLSAGDWGRWKDGRFRSESVPTLEEVLAIVPEGRGILVEVKDSARIVPTLVRDLDRSGLKEDRVKVITFDREVVKSMKRLAPRWKVLWLTSFSKRTGVWLPSVDEVIEVARSIGADGVDVQAEPDVVDRSFVDRVRLAGLEIHCWTVNDVELARKMSSIGMASITTDRPRVIREALGR